MALRRTTLLAAAALLLLPSADAGAGRGFVSTRPLHRVAGSVEPGARGGYMAWFRVRNDRTTVQGLRVWFDGLEDAEGASLHMSKPGEAELSEIGAFALSGDDVDGRHSGIYEVIVDSADDEPAEIPAGAESMVRLLGAPIEVRVSSGDPDLDDLPVLEGEVGKFRFRKLKVDGAGLPGRRASLRRPPPPAVVLDARATGTATLWRRRIPGSPGDYDQGILLLARGLTEEGNYEVWIEDPAGDMVFAGEFDASIDGLGFFSIDSREGDDFPVELDADSVRDLKRRRVEVRRSGFSEYSLAGLFR